MQNYVAPFFVLFVVFFVLGCLCCNLCQGICVVQTRYEGEVKLLGSQKPLPEVGLARRLQYSINMMALFGFNYLSSFRKKKIGSQNGSWGESVPA
jgi:hypothetical protein